MFLVLAVLLSIMGAAAQTVKGKVLDDTKNPLIGVSVLIKGTQTGTISDENGLFTLTGVNKNSVLIFSYIGFQKAEKTVGESKMLTVVMQENDKQLDEILVIGYGSSKRKDLTGAIASVDSKAINGQAVQNAAQALQGKVAGVQITNSGTPGSNPQVRIRGLGTVTDGSNPLYVVDNVIVNDISYLGPNDIENISILKDASSAAIYGVRAAGGVILITTKKGLDGKPTVSFDAYVGQKNAAHLVEMANGSEYVQMYNEKMALIGDPSRLDPTKYTSHNYYDDVLRKNVTTNSQNLTITGGSSVSRYSIGLNHLKDDGLVQDDNYDRIGFRSKYDMNITKAFRAGFTTIFTTTKSNPQSTYYIFKAHQVLPLFDPKTPTGEWTDPLSVGRDLNVAAAHFYDKNSFSNGINAILNGYLEADILKDFTFKTSFSLNPTYSANVHYYPTYNVSSYQNSPRNTMDKSKTENLNMFWDNTLTYTKTIAVDHHLKVMVGTSYQEQTWNTLSGHAEGFKDLPEINSSYLFLSMPKIDGQFSSSNSDDGDKDVAVSYLGRLSYDFKNKYLFNATFRNDISSKFPKKNRSAIFPAFGAGWVISSEDFMANSAFNFLKVKVNWGLMGNGIIPSNIYVPTIDNGTYGSVIYGNQQNSGSGSVAFSGTVTQFYNPDLKWETVSEFDAGIEAKFLKERLSVVLDYYNRDTRDAIFPITGIGSSGISASGVWGNNATINNSGVEISLGWSETKKDFSYSVSGNMTYNKNEVTKLAASSAGGIYGKFYDFPPTLTYSTIGHPIGEFYGLQAIGVFQNAAQIASTPHMSGAIPGDLIFADLNDDKTIDEKDRTFLGNPNPPIYYGLDASVAYKGFDMGISVQGVSGNKILNAVSMWRYGTENFEKYMVDNRWHGEGTSNEFPSAALSNAQTTSSFYVEDGSYLRIKSLQIGYSLPSSLLAKVGINKVRFYLNGENLHTFTKYRGFSPEVAGGSITGGVDKEAYPLSTVYSFGVNLNF